MANGSCGREADTIRAARGERPGPDVDLELAAHLAGCPGCAEIAWMAEALRAERDAACVEAHPPSAGAVWWRAQRRAREEAARRAARPIALVHAIALGCTAAAAVAFLGFGLGNFGSLFSEWAAAISWPALPAASTAVAALANLPLGLVLALTAALVLAPVAVYLAVSEK